MVATHPKILCKQSWSDSLGIKNVTIVFQTNNINYTGIESISKIKDGGDQIRRIVAVEWCLQKNSLTLQYFP